MSANDLSVSEEVLNETRSGSTVPPDFILLLPASGI